ncbi:squalene/phytoene synthase family protein [Streptomyces sp. NPDC048002]|uniref:phytoene/squalene synthase family protein n=1 Tax=Streptomyces sp. NPDC048002 TaxID=3154344 RepID=UPI0033E7FF53
MTRWSVALDRAGIRDPELRRDYDAQRRIVRRFDPHAYLAARLLLPARLHPPVMAAVSFMHGTDELIDSGDVEFRQRALRSWGHEVLAALEQPSANPTLRALADTVRRHPHLAARVREFLDGAAVEAAWTGFESEKDFQVYVDQYSLPALMLTASLIAPPGESERSALFQQHCRALIEGWQRIDNLADLREDVAAGQIGVPRLTLAEHGLTPEELRGPAADLAAVGRLIGAQAGLAGKALDESRALPELVEEEFRPFVTTLVAVQELRLEALRRKGGAVLAGEVRPPLLRSVGVLARQGLRARTLRGR